MKKAERDQLIERKLLEAGHDPNERQLVWVIAFCTPGQCFRDSVAAAERAGYPDPIAGGDLCYGEFGQDAQAIIHELKLMETEVWNTVAAQMKATTTKVISHQGLVTDYVYVADNGARINAARLAADMLGMKAPEKSEITIFDPAERLRRAEERLKNAE